MSQKNQTEPKEKGFMSKLFPKHDPIDTETIGQRQAAQAMALSNPNSNQKGVDWDGFEADMEDFSIESARAEEELVKAFQPLNIEGDYQDRLHTDLTRFKRQLDETQEAIRSLKDKESQLLTVIGSIEAAMNAFHPTPVLPASNDLQSKKKVKSDDEQQ